MNPESYLYVEEEIPESILWQEFIHLMYQHTGIRVWDWWLDGSELYVDLESIEAQFFNWGSTGSNHRGMVLTKTLASFPGVSQFEVLVGGFSGVSTSHYSFNWVAIVEDGEIIRLDPK